MKVTTSQLLVSKHGGSQGGPVWHVVRAARARCVVRHRGETEAASYHWSRSRSPRPTLRTVMVKLESPPF